MNNIYLPKNSEVSFCSAGRFAPDAPTVHPKRKLKNAVLLIGENGEYPIAQNGNSFILKRGSAMLLFPNTVHYGIAESSGRQSHYWCHFNLPQDFSYSFEEKSFCLPEYIENIETEKYIILFHQLISAEYKSYCDLDTKNAVCGHYLNIILRCLADDYMKQLSNNPDGNTPRAVVARLCEWVRLHADEDISVGQIALIFGYSADYLTKLVKTHTGMTLCGYIRYIRLEMAKRLLLSTSMHISAVAFKVGFRDEKYFIKCFKKHIGVPPSEYRNAYSEIHENIK